MRKPRKVYKYFDFAPDNSELKKRECNGSLECLSIDRANSIKALRGRYVWASKPTSFNDPFDCQRRMSSKITREVYIRTGLAMGYGRTTIYKACELMFDARGHLTEVGLETINGLVDKAYQLTAAHGVVCFTTTPVNELMWSHYSDSHRGFCLEFDLDLAPTWKKFLMGVEYVANNVLPQITLEDVLRGLNGGPGALQLILAKSKNWKYEREWRLVLEHGNCEVAYPEEALTGVIFGKNIDDDNVRLLTKIIPAGEGRVHYSCQPSDKHFKYHLVKI